jgi:transcriptional regulator with XRE-family HTH domain
MLFAQQLKKLRIKNNLSQDRLAKKLSFSQQTIAKWESEQSTPSPEILVKIAALFNVSTDYLLGYENPNSVPKTLSPEAERLHKRIDEADTETLAELEQYLSYLESKKNTSQTK